MRKITGLLIGLSFLLWGCGSSDTQENLEGPPETNIPDESGSDDTEDTEDNESNADISLLKVQVENWVREQEAQLDTFECTTTPSSQCQNTPQDFNSGVFNPLKTDETQTILIIDDEGLEFPAITRYRSRVKAAYQQNANGKYVAYNPIIEAPEYILELLRALDTFVNESDEPTYIPPSINSFFININTSYSFK